MSSEAITRNDLKAILNEVLPPTPSEYKKLLWTNPSPFSAFGAQTVVSNTDLTLYDEIEIYYAANTGYPDCDHIVRQPIGTNSYIFGSSNWLTAKNVSITTTAIGFGDTVRYSYGGNGTTDNAQLIPQKIYGIKYERVNPPQIEMADCVIEQGTNANGSYRKWNSGTMEQWGLEASASSSAHAVYFPEAFISTAYTVVCSNTSGVQANFMPSSTNVAYFTVYPTASVQLFWIAIGKWK